MLKAIETQRAGRNPRPFFYVTKLDKPPIVPTRSYEQRRKHERDGRKELNENVHGWTGGVFEGIADGVADDGGFVRIAALFVDIALLIAELAGLDVLFRIVPGTAAVVHHSG